MSRCHFPYKLPAAIQHTAQEEGAILPQGLFVGSEVFADSSQFRRPIFGLLAAVRMYT